VLPNLISVSDAEYALLRDRDVITVDWENGLRDGNWALRTSPLNWPDVIDIEIDALPTGLPFGLEAPETIAVSFYSDDYGGLFLFSVHIKDRGEIVLNAEESLTISIFRRGQSIEELHGYD
jgi:hypothetical protein